MQYNPFSLEGKHILITGASSGIGQACAEYCSKMGARVTLSGRDKERLAAVLETMEGDGHIIVPADVSDHSNVGIIVSKSVKDNGPIDGFIHSAGVELVLPLKLMKSEHYYRIFSVNVFAALEFAKNIAKKGNYNEDGCSLVFIASVAGIKGEAVKVGYSSSKAALINGVRSIANELAPKGIRANCVSPAVCLTKMSKAFLAKLDDENRMKIESKHPLGFGHPEDVAFSCGFLLSNTSKWITGSNLVVDGGYSIN